MVTGENLMLGSQDNAVKFTSIPCDTGTFSMVGFKYESDYTFMSGWIRWLYPSGFESFYADKTIPITLDLYGERRRCADYRYRHAKIDAKEHDRIIEFLKSNGIEDSKTCEEIIERLLKGLIL